MYKKYTLENQKVSVLMPVYNAEMFLAESISSILNQTFTNFELIIIDDGSTDNSLSIIKSFNDDRIKLVTLEKNKGIVAALNIGIEMAKGIYLARMDADDIAFTDKLEKQVKFLEQNIDIGCIGTDFLWYDDPTEKSWIKYYEIEDIKISLLFGCPICHPTIMIRLSILKFFNLRYSYNYPHAEDYFLWTELSQVSKIANLKEPLLYYRRHLGQISLLQNSVQSRSMIQIQLLQLKNLGLINVRHSDILVHKALNNTFFPLINLEYLLNRWCNKLKEINLISNYFNSHILNEYLKQALGESVLKINFQLSKLSIKQKTYWILVTWFRFQLGKVIRFQELKKN